MPSLSGQQFEVLRDLVVEAFNADSLFQLVRLELGVDMYKEYVPTGKPFKESVFLLIAALEERGTTGSFIDSILAARPEKAEIQKELPGIRGFLDVAKVATSDQVSVVAKAITTAASNVNKGTIPAASADLLKKLRGDLDLIQIYKTLHDCLHKAQMHLSPLEIESRNIGVSGQEDASDRFSVSLDAFIMEGMNARQAAALLPAEPTFLREVEGNWLKLYDDASALSKKALDTGDGVSARLSTKRFRGILRKEPSRIDGILRSCTSSLDLVGLRGLLEKLGEPGSQNAGDLAEGTQAAEFLFRRLKALVNQHNQWQSIDQSLWEAEDQLPSPSDPNSDPGDFEILWIDLSSSLQLLIDNAPASEWALSLSAQKAKTDAAWAARSWKDLSRSFRQFRKICLMTFFAIDNELKGLADKISKLRDSLNELLTKLTP
jgi:hypothetical protein